MITPLAKYLQRHKLTHKAFAELLSISRGYEAYREQITLWASGKRGPGYASQGQLDDATGGAVTPRQWAAWEAKQRKS